MDNFFLMGLIAFCLGSGTDRYNKKVEPPIMTLFFREGFDSLRYKIQVQ